MAHESLTIATDGTITPTNIHVNPGDTVSFHADGDDAVLCVDPDILFGAERYEIPDGDTITLTVQNDATHITFAFLTVMGDLTAACGGARGGVNGSGGDTGPP